MKAKVLTSKILERLVREVLEEGKHIPFKTNSEREEHLKTQRREAEERRQKQKELRPDYDLMKLGKGILQEEELLAEPDNDGYVRVKEAALHRLLSENSQNLEMACNKASYYKLDQILSFIAKMNNAQKGKG